MKYCSHCGAEAKDDAKFCEYCGNQFAVVNSNVNENTNTNTQSSNVNDNNVYYNGTNVNGTPSYTQPESTALGICAVIFSLIITVVGLILGIVCLTTKRDKANRTLGAIAIVISVVWIIMATILYSTGVLKL